MTNFELGDEPHSYRPSVGGVEYPKQLRRKQMKSFAIRLWILQDLYEHTLDGKQGEVEEISSRHGIDEEEVKIACNILKETNYIKYEGHIDDGTPYGLELTGYTIERIENAPINHFDVA